MNETENIHNMSHADFVVGMQNKTIGCLLGEPYGLCNGVRKTLFNILTMLYIAAPLIVVPLRAYYVGDWWVLAGVAASYVGTSSARQYSQMIFWFSCYCIGFWIHNGFSIDDYTTYFFFCALWGYILWHLADTARMNCARQSLIESPEFYNKAIVENRIRIVRRDSSQHNILTTEDITASFTGKGLNELKPFMTLLVLSNIINMAFTYIFGLFTGLIGVIKTHVKGINNLLPKTADSIMRQLKKGTVGILVMILGYLGIYSIYGLLFAVFWFSSILWSLISTTKKH